VSLDNLLHAWLPHQRWYGGKGRPVATIEAPLGAPILSDDATTLALAIARVTYTDGTSEDYQVPVSMRTERWNDIEHALIGESDGVAYYDAPHDPTAAAMLLNALRDAAATPETYFHRIGDIPTGLHARLVGAEQSNTSIVFGEDLILKLFRRLAAGLNPDLELTRALQDAGSTHVAPVRGWISTAADESSPDATTTLAVLQQFAPSASEGWALALTSVRDLYAEADLHADEVGGDFAAESRRLGAATAEVHAVLASTLPTVTAGPADLERAVTAMNDRLTHAVREVPNLEPYETTMRHAFEAAVAATRTKPHVLQRIHGDFHLGQVLRTDSGWLILDFEGEPARPLAERRAPASPLRDVAGMLRSFDYAARSVLTDHPPSPGLEYRATEWAERNRDAFCDGYADVAADDPRTDRALLRAFELDKAVYEVIYEARHRPSWISIPLGSIARLAA
jgi:maltokinase